MRLATTALVIASLLSAVSAFALDVRPPRAVTSPTFTLGSYVCDNGIDANAFFQDDSRRYGNEFDFGPNPQQISTVEFTHNGYQTLPGPYTFDIELWDPATCTFMGSADALAANDAYFGSITESFNICPEQLFAYGRVAVMIDANSCYAANDCYPDISFDNTLRDCQLIITPGTPSLCQTVPTLGDFLLRVGVNDCATGTRQATWGTVKSRYR